MNRQMRVATWNAEGMFVLGSKTIRATPHDAIAVVKRLNADIIYVPEFGTTNKVDETIITTLHSLGYEAVIFSYNQAKLGSYGSALITRLPIVAHTIHSFTNTNRQFIEATIVFEDQKVRVIGLHLDDTSEKFRLEQVPEVAKVVNTDRKTPTIVLGDFNAMHKSAAFARVARARPSRYIAGRVPHKKLRSVIMRVTQMAIGSTLELLINSTGLKDLDGKGRKTISARQAGLEWIPSVRLAKIDWILGSSTITTVSYRVLPDVGSDHRPVLAVLHVPILQ